MGSEPFKLVAWNVFQGLHHATKRKNWIHNLDLEQHLAALDADVLVLPEMWRFGKRDATWAEDIAAGLGYELHQWIGDRPSRDREFVNWRMVIMTRLPATRLDDYVCEQLPRFGQRAVVRVELTESGLTLAGLHLYGIHAVRPNPRHWLVERGDLREVGSSHDIVAGDFNMWGPVVRRDTPGLRSAVTGRTFPSQRPHSQIDHILVSNRVEVLDGAVLPDMGSDHRAGSALLNRSARADG